MSKADRVFAGSLAGICALIVVIANIAGSLGAMSSSPGSNNSTQAPQAERSPQASVGVTLTAAKASSGPFYLDGAYSLRFSVTHSSENCLLVVYARAPGDSIGTVLFSDVVSGNTGTYPVYKQSFTWDDAQFYGENYTIVSEGACEEVRVELLSLDHASATSSGSSAPSPGTATSPTPSASPTPTRNPSDLASENVCSFARATMSDTAGKGALTYAFGRISLREMGLVYRDWANRAEELLGMNKEAKKSIKREVTQTIEFAMKTASAARSGNSNLALDYSGRFLNGAVYKVCRGY